VNDGPTVDHHRPAARVGDDARSTLAPSAISSRSPGYYRAPVDVRLFPAANQSHRGQHLGIGVDQVPRVVDQRNRPPEPAGKGFPPGFDPLTMVCGVQSSPFGKMA